MTGHEKDYYDNIKKQTILLERIAKALEVLVEKTIKDKAKNLLNG